MASGDYWIMAYGPNGERMEHADQTECTLTIATSVANVMKKSGQVSDYIIVKLMVDSRDQPQRQRWEARQA